MASSVLMVVSARLFFRDVVPCLKEVIRSWGLPLELYFTPPCYRALLRECIAYHDPELWPSLVVLANDEKDVYRKLPRSARHSVMMDDL